MLLLALLVWILALATANLVSAFGNFAHRLIATLVWERLEPDTRIGIRSLIGASSFSSLACWADEVKHQPEYKWTQRLHFADMPDDPPTYCAVDFTADDNVVSAAINFTRRARKSKEDLAFMIHFLMDLHMPMHCSP
ncbi:hypothetical protein PSACC_02199 [Paramicrosporidium saccamoebae]|uniref:Uncharacterized protein n=1 Tax=Paramicrosporidium saccamoebae TaxID=1246581 RepID=A0A2H9TJP1_9FUNG|nr:hypothetical protein PSACC_02199 [Paramicrosporidium saccamoebae]